MMSANFLLAIWKRGDDLSDATKQDMEIMELHSSHLQHPDF